MVTLASSLSRCAPFPHYMCVGGVPYAEFFGGNGSCFIFFLDLPRPIGSVFFPVTGFSGLGLLFVSLVLI